MEEREVVDELRRLVCVKLAKIKENILFDVFDELFIISDLSEPLL